MRAKIDQTRCIACQTCVGYCPGVFRMSERGPAEVYVKEVPKEDEDMVEEAAEFCPMQVISIS